MKKIFRFIGAVIAKKHQRKEQKVINQLRNALFAVEDAYFAKRPYPRQVVLDAIHISN